MAKGNDGQIRNVARARVVAQSLLTSEALRIIGSVMVMTMNKAPVHVFELLSDIVPKSAG